MPEPTPFQTKVYEACLRIPPGKVCTYGDVARGIGCDSAQAVGQALRRNPFAPRVPCHRVVAADRTIGGFSGHRDGPEIGRKIALLQEEGVRFDAAGRVDPACLWEFSLAKRAPDA